MIEVNIKVTDKFWNPDRKPCGQSLIQKSVNHVNYIRNIVTL